MSWGLKTFILVTLFIFVLALVRLTESALHGHNYAWKGHVHSYEKTIRRIVEECREFPHLCRE